MFKPLVAVMALGMATGATNGDYSLLPAQSFPTDFWPETAVVGDINGDGRDDVAVATSGTSPDEFKVLVFFQQGNGELAPPLIASYPAVYWIAAHGMAIGDMDEDGRQDVVLGYSDGIGILRWTSTGGRMDLVSTFYDDIGSVPDVAVADVDRDGHLDVVAQTFERGLVVNFGDGHGEISNRTNPAPGYTNLSADLKSADINNDGHVDIVARRGGRIIDVYFNDATDDLAPPLQLDMGPSGEYGSGVAVGDFNNDGHPDVAAGYDAYSIALFLQGRRDDFAAPIIVPLLDYPTYPTALQTRDMNADGRADLVVGHDGGTIGVLLQGDDGFSSELVPSGLYQTHINSQGISTGDINGDGCLDVASANSNEGLVVNFGTGCQPRPDLVPSVASLERSLVSVRLDNLGDAVADAPSIAVELSVISGSLSVGVLPAQCSLVSQTVRRSKVVCTDVLLQAASNFTRQIPITLQNPSHGRDVLTVSAKASAANAEKRMDNNSTRRILVLALRNSRIPTGAAPARPGRR